MCLENLLRRFTTRGMPDDLYYSVIEPPQATEKEKSLRKRVDWIQTEGRKQVHEMEVKLKLKEPEKDQPVNLPEVYKEKRSEFELFRAQRAGRLRAWRDHNANAKNSS